MDKGKIIHSAPDAQIQLKAWQSDKGTVFQTQCSGTFELQCMAVADFILAASEDYNISTRFILRYIKDDIKRKKRSKRCCISK